ncbi:MAG: hypothetical protein JKY09_02915 [Crocinitomicaceae bacterium]|nr:hypothetical protein [Crocinitomicaceae bacterium]
MRLVILLVFCMPFFSKGQSYFTDHFGGTVGLVVNIGTHVRSVGLNAKGYYTDYFYQVNAGSTFYLHQASYGGRKKFWESRNTLGLVLLAGKRESPIDFQLDGLNHQTPYNYGIGFNYLMYTDNKGTTQQSGAFGLHFKQLAIYHENDVFGGQGKDRFRTGHVQFAYRHNDFKFAAGINLWTGETTNSPWERIRMDGCPNGFRNLENLPYGRTSHGIGYGSLTYNLPYGQDIHFKLGIDSDQIRHSFQNRLIHDLVFLPKKVERHTPHYPRLDEHGCPVFDKKDVRKNKLFLQIGVNDNWAN